VVGVPETTPLALQAALSREGLRAGSGARALLVAAPPHLLADMEAAARGACARGAGGGADENASNPAAAAAIPVVGPALASVWPHLSLEAPPPWPLAATPAAFSLELRHVECAFAAVT
jgi:hypothetical protein